MNAIKGFNVKSNFTNGKSRVEKMGMGKCNVFGHKYVQNERFSRTLIFFFIYTTVNHDGATKGSVIHANVTLTTLLCFNR